MKLTTILVAAFSLAFLAACDRGEPRPRTDSPAASGSTAAPRNEAAPMSSANQGRIERNPVQQQVDPKEPAQQRDFKHPQTGGK